MSYICIDAGAEKCPCQLAEVGQCYTCNMLADKRCNCSTQWRGSCPYTEFVQNLEKGKAGCRYETLEIIDRKPFGTYLEVFRLRTHRGFAQKCHRPGAYIMVESSNHLVPLSVLRSVYEGDESYIEIGLQPTGIKTKKLAEDFRKSWNIKGIYYGGLKNFSQDEMQKEGGMLVIAKGISIAPFLNIVDEMESQRQGCIHLFVDVEKITEEFLELYYKGRKYQKINLYDQFDEISELIRFYPQCMFLASPFYIKKLEEKWKETTMNHPKIILPNHSNICCGLGICGSCSYTDDQGMTVKNCKCTSKMDMIY